MERKLRWYFGGLWDGDGSFGVSKKANWNQHSGPAKTWMRYQPFAIITLCTPRAQVVFDKLETEFGFKCVARTHRGNKKWRIAHVWQVSSQKACDFAKALEPYLIIKKEQAQILTQWPKKWNGMSKDERQSITERQEELYQQMKVLNKRGA